MYSPKILEDHVRRLYKIKEYYGVPMTLVTNEILDFGIPLIEDSIRKEKDENQNLIDQYRPFYPIYTESSLTSAVKDIKVKHNRVDAVTLDHFLRPKCYGGLGYGKERNHEIGKISEALRAYLNKNGRS